MEEEETVKGDNSADTDKVTCEDIINQIRKSEFGVGVMLSEEGQRLVAVCNLPISLCVTYLLYLQLLKLCRGGEYTRVSRQSVVRLVCW